LYIYWEKNQPFAEFRSALPLLSPWRVCQLRLPQGILKFNNHSKLMLYKIRSHDILKTC